MIRLLSALILLLLAGASLPAQQQAPVHKAVQPKYAGTYKMATGEFLPAVGTRNSGVGAVVIFNNTTPTNYYSVPGNNQEWIDEGVLNDRNAFQNEQLRCFEVIYCSTDPAATGTIIYTFYDETIECTGPTGGVPGTPNCAYALTGLPMGTPTGGIQCWIVTVDLNGGFECPNNTSETFRTTGAHPANPLFGWGILPQLDNTGPWLRKGGKGTTNDFVWYDRNAGTNVGCFWFGGVPFASFSMKIWGGPAGAIVVVDNDTNAANGRWGNNPGDTVSLSSGALARGAFATFTIDNPTAGLTYYLCYATGIMPRSITGAFGTTFTLLLNPIPPSSQCVPMPGGTVTRFVPAGAPAPLYVQAFCATGPPPHTASDVTGSSAAICF